MDKDTTIEVTSEMIAADESVLEWWESDECLEWRHSAVVRAMYIAMETSRRQAQGQKS
jgi:hypothetical protein